MDSRGTDFWEYSLALYARPGVAAACLALQDRHGCEVNLLLLCFWRAKLGLGGWMPGEISRAEDSLRPLQDVLRPLRQARRALKPLGPDDPVAADLYVGMKALELRLEQLAQAYLAGFGNFSAAPRHPGGRADEMAAAAGHLMELLGHNPIPGGATADREGLAADLLRAAFG